MGADLSQIIELKLNAKKRQVYIKATNKEVGKEIASEITSKTTLTGGWPVKNIRQGLGYKDFTVIMKNQDGAKYLHDKIQSLRDSENSGGSETSNESAGESSNESLSSSISGSNSKLFIVAGVIILISVGIMLWMRNK